MTTFSNIKSKVRWVYILELGRKVQAVVFAKDTGSDRYLVQYDGDVYDVSGQDISW